MIIRYLDYLERLQYEVIQRREEWRDVHEIGDAFDALRANPDGRSQRTAYKLLADLMAQDASTPTGSASEPDDLIAIRLAAGGLAPIPQSSLALDDADLYDRILGGWLGRAAGCLLGKPIERYPRDVIRQLLESNDSWPLSNYWTQTGMPQNLLDLYPWKRRGGLESLRENIECMPEDDDLNYPMLNLHIAESCGHDFTGIDIGTAWLSKLPVFQTFTAERVAYFNLLEGREPPESATYMNPYREWIGAQIRADLWAYISPGNPHQAAEFAWRDATLSHTANGVYGEMFFAALIANAFVESDVRTLVESALAHVPRNSRFALAINKVLQLPIGAMDWEAVVDELYSQFGSYHWVHTINNAALTVAALLKGDGDYEQTICNTVMGGWDTDSNGATAGSIVGVVLGAKALPDKWTKPLNDRIRTSLGGFDNARFTDLARRTLLVAQRTATDTSIMQAQQADDF